jgi:RarD protein
MKAQIAYISSMVIFGTIGLCVRFIDLPSSEIALCRGLLGSLCFIPVILFSNRRNTVWSDIKRNWKILLLSSTLLDGNWIFLFESFRHTTLAIASLLYYIAPIFVLVFSALFFRERITVKGICAISITLIGMFLLTDVASTKGTNFLGIVYGIAASMCYAGLMITNKVIKDMGSVETTTVQLSLSTVLLVPYILLTETQPIHLDNPLSITLVIVLGIIHTGLGFFLFFYGIKRL